MPGAPLLISSNEHAARRPRPSRPPSRSGTWSVATRSSEPSARPAHSASRSAAERSGGEMTKQAQRTGSGSS